MNDTTTIPAGMARLVVRHTAAAPAVDVRANGKLAFKSLTNPHQAMVERPAGSMSADVVLAGASTAVIGPANLTLSAGTQTIRDRPRVRETVALVVQTIGGLGAVPYGMPPAPGCC